MGARILSLVLGLMLGGFGWAIVDPKGPAAARMPPLDLGMFEGHRMFIGWGLVALGIVALLSAVLPKSKPGKSTRSGPPLVDFDAAPQIEEHPAPTDHHDPDAHGHPVSNSGSPRPSALW